MNEDHQDNVEQDEFTPDEDLPKRPHELTAEGNSNAPSEGADGAIDSPSFGRKHHRDPLDPPPREKPAAVDDRSPTSTDDENRGAHEADPRRDLEITHGLLLKTSGRRSIPGRDIDGWGKDGHQQISDSSEEAFPSEQHSKLSDSALHTSQSNGEPSHDDGSGSPSVDFDDDDSGLDWIEGRSSEDSRYREEDIHRFRRIVSDLSVNEAPQDSSSSSFGQDFKRDDLQETAAFTPPFTDDPDEWTEPFRPSTADTPTPPRGRPFTRDLPQRVPERDMGATQVTPAAYKTGRPPSPPRRRRGCILGGTSGYGGCLLRMAILGLFGLIALLIVLASFALYQYSIISDTLPSVEDLKEHADQFETTRILDREGNLLYEIVDPQAGRRTYVSLDEISPYMVASIIAIEDSQFYSHPGFDPLAIARAYWQSYQKGDIASGASTITQQIARMLLLSPEEASRRTALRKIREVLLATEITRRYTKDEILELYLNQSYFGNLAYGVEAAAETYFNTTADKLTLAQSSFLAGLVQAPSVYDIFTNREATLDRHQQVLMLIVRTSSEQGCIYVSNSTHPICVSAEEAGVAAAEVASYEFEPVTFDMRYPHWVNYIRAELEQLYDPQTIYRSGFTVYTTLDPYLQEQAQRIVREQVEALAGHRVSSGALVTIRPGTGEILAMVGSADFYNEEIDGQINMAIRPRQPGSSIKPLTYAAAFEKGWTAATLIWDVPSEFPPSGDPNDTRSPYKPVNYDGRFHGPVTVRTALANSYNIPAVKTLDFVGIYDNPTTEQEEGLVAFARRMGITTLTQEDYGLSLTLGGGEVTLLDLTGAYAIFANGGYRIPPYAISRIVDHNNETVYEYTPAAAEEIIRPEHAYLINSILSDNNARTPMFGANSALNLPFQVAAKTGTTNDFRDNWTLGYTPDLAVGVWIGNADWTPMQDTSGLSGAAPIWNQFMQLAIEHLTGGFPSTFTAPPGIVERAICSVSGAEPSEWCPSHKLEIFASDQPPLPKEQDLWQKVWIDSWTLELASPECHEFTEEKLGLDVKDIWGRKWITEEKAGKEWAEEMGFPEDKIYFIPLDTCSSESSRPMVSLTFPPEESTITTIPIPIFGRASATADFKEWVLQYGRGQNPSTWTKILLSDIPHDQPDNLLDWDPTEAGSGPITLRLVVRSTKGGSAEDRIHLTVNLPTETPTSTPTETITPTPTSTPTPTTTQTPTLTPTPSYTSTVTPSVTPSPTSTS
jgi:penicillin-binding protein 1C